MGEEGREVRVRERRERRIEHGKDNVRKRRQREKTK